MRRQTIRGVLGHRRGWFGRRGASDRGRIEPAVRSTKRLIAFLLWAAAAGGIWSKAMRWLQPPRQGPAGAPPADPRAERRRSGRDRRWAERRSRDRRQGANDMAAWIGAVTERRSGGERRQPADRRTAERRRQGIPV
jgi:hypothetical protein